MKKLKDSILLCTFLILLTSCKTGSILGVHERCTILGEESICSDSRTRNPPMGCEKVPEQKNTYICPNSRLLGYQATSIDSYNYLSDKIDDIIIENKTLKEELRQCNGL